MHFHSTLILDTFEGNLGSKGSKRSKTSFLPKNDYYKLILCVGKLFDPRNFMEVSIFSISKNFSYLGGFPEVKRGEKLPIRLKMSVNC